MRKPVPRHQPLDTGPGISGITHFSSGLPVTLVKDGDNPLLGAEPNGINNYGIDEPDYNGGPLDLNRNPRNGRSYFNTSQFSDTALGTPGTAERRFFLGTGVGQLRHGAAQGVGLFEAKSLHPQLRESSSALGGGSAVTILDRCCWKLK
ncbi:MAG TPA: hypothetical protein VK788_01700 [Terriglobales bacterium]|jgi:hypothetical protein|nr:hypothetical protein [Terriglobales bacterium]